MVSLIISSVENPYIFPTITPSRRNETVNELLPICPAADRYVFVLVGCVQSLELVDGVSTFGVTICLELHPLSG